VAQAASDLAPGDEHEADDIAVTLRWLQQTDDVFRRVKPDVPDRHLVSYVVPVDPDSGHVLLGEHLNAGLWLPPGGHVEVDEHPAVTASREAAEELGIDAPARLRADPMFLSSTRTVGRDSGHTDVSLWFLLVLRRHDRLDVDHREFRSVRWWSPDEVRAVPSGCFDPAFGRFTAKLATRSSE
jgi:8-oxo-dGTP pyrophosphatase MutT (NUDIX family)